MKDAQCFVVQNYDAQPAKAQADLKRKLSKQMESPVRWCATIEYMLQQGVDTFIEIGPGKVLSGTVKKIDKNAKFFNVFDAQTLKDTIAQTGIPTPVS